MKTTVGRLLTGVVALALLLGGFGLMQDSAQAQVAASIAITAGSGSSGDTISFIRSCDPYPDRTDVKSATGKTAAGCSESGGDNEFIITVMPDEGAAQQVEVYNTSLPKSGSDNDQNPRMFDSLPEAIYAVPRTTNLRENEIKAFSGNVIQVTYTPPGTLGVVETLTVDNVKPTLVVTSPAHETTVKGSTNVTFSAEFTDGGAGFGTDADNLLVSSAPLGAKDEPMLGRGDVQLVIAGNIVGLVKDDFEAIDDGWRVTKALNSSTLQAISSNVPWYFHVKDSAGNMQRTTTSISLSSTAADKDSVRDTRFGGDTSGSTLGKQAFAGSSIRVTRGSESENLLITEFAFGSGEFTVVGSNPFADGDAIDADDKFALLETSLLIVDSSSPTLGPITTGRGLSGNDVVTRKNGIEVVFNDNSTDDNDGNGSGIDAATVAPGTFSVAGNTVTSVAVKDNVVYLNLADNLASTETPRVNIAGGVIMDKAGNVFAADDDNAKDGLGPNLSLAESGDLSSSSVSITITSDELLNGAPTIMLGRVVESDGTVLNHGDMECIYTEVKEGKGPAPEPELQAMTIPLGANETCAAAATEHGLDVRYAEDQPKLDGSPIAGQPPAASAQQSTALSYTYTATGTSILGDNAGGRFTVHVRGCDTQGTEDAENCSTVGDNKSVNNAGAFSFQIDTKLNGDDSGPEVTVSNAEDVGNAETVPEVETISPMIVTVDYNGESNEYKGDTYRTVTLTSAVLKISFTDGTSESTTFDLDTQVDSADSIKYTIPLVNPKVGTYTLTVKAEDSAGNTVSDGHDVTWKVVAAKAVPITLKPGWNLISLPFQPANPAINSVIPSDHPITLVMTFDGATGVWLFSRRDAESGLFVGDVGVITATNAYFVNTEKFVPLELLRPPVATAAAAPAQPPAIVVSKGWNLIPVSTNDPGVKGIDADTYFGTLGASWLQALAWNPLARSWIAISPGGTDTVADDPIAPKANASTPANTATDRCERVHSNDKIFSATQDNSIDVGSQVCVGEGLWLWVNEDGTLIPRN